MKTFLKRYYPIIITLFILPLIIGCGSSSSSPTYQETELSAEDFGTIGDGDFHDYGTGGEGTITSDLDSLLAGYEGKYDDDEDSDPETESDDKDEFSGIEVEIGD